MLTKWIIKKVIKDSEEVEQECVRSQYLYFAGGIGILTNFLLFVIKFGTGVLSGSIAIMADAFNNLSDMASAIVTMAGVKLANRPADKEHPYGHGRIEYIAALIVAFMVMVVGFQFLQASVTRIFEPVPVSFDWLTFLLLMVSILVKIWLSQFNLKIGKKINAAALKAAGADALGDVFISSTVVISFAIAPHLHVAVDGYAGVLVALFILYMSYTLVKETISPLLGEAPEPKLVNEIIERILSYPYITGAHDLIIHNYGVGRVMASIHAEIPASIDIMEIHEVIDQAEREISEALSLHLVIHMDPVSEETEETRMIKSELQDFILAHPVIFSMHDFRIIGKEPNKSLIFDLNVDGSKLNKTITEEKIKEEVKDYLKQLYPTYTCILVIDKEYLS